MLKPDIGAAAEYRFAAEMLSRGIVPSWPSVETQPYDMIIDLGASRRRIQIKGTEQEGPQVTFQFRRRDGKKTKTYTAKEVDFIVLYLYSKDLWYIFPVKETRSTMIIKPEDLWCKYRKYRNAWKLLDKSLK